MIASHFKKSETSQWIYRGGLARTAASAKPQRSCNLGRGGEQANRGLRPRGGEFERGSDGYCAERAKAVRRKSDGKKRGMFIDMH